MDTRIAVAGATGNLGKRIVKSLATNGAKVVALARVGTDAEKLKELSDLGAEAVTINLNDVAALSRALEGSSCVVSALQGLRNVIVGTQSVLLDAALMAGVPRFIPSDFSTDFTKLTPGENRNFDLRREFHDRLDTAAIAATSIFNGAFADILHYDLPLLNTKTKTVGYWDSPDLPVDFTTMDDTAAYTAAAAQDANTPRALRIASFQVSPNDLLRFTAERSAAPYKLVRLGSLEELRESNKRERAAHPEGESDLYASWQQGQYLQSMFSAHHESPDNGRYPDLTWTPLEAVIQP